MKYTSLFRFYWFGTCLRFLQDVRTNSPVGGEGFVQENIESFFNYLTELELTVTERVAKDQLKKIMGKLSDYEEGQKLSSEDAISLKKAMQNIRITLDAEIKGLGAYIPTPKRIDLQKLLENVAGLFAPDTYNKLPDIARYDFRQAGKCVAYELPTAAAFHILRGTEGVLRHYYCQMVRSQRITSRMWGPIVEDLREKILTKKYDILNNHLDNIRHSFRNPTQHPEATYDIHEVQDLWSLCVDVVNKMISTMDKEGRG